MTKKDVLLLAMGNEIKATKFYQKLADLSTRQDMKSTFERLAQFEHGHFEKLKTIYFNEFPEFTIMNFEDNEEFKGRTDFHDPADVIRYGMEVEADMQKSYRELAEMYKAQEQEITFLELAREESYHEEILEGELQKLQGVYTWFDLSELNGKMDG